jgi:hypothetical protein
MHAHTHAHTHTHTHIRTPSLKARARVPHLSILKCCQPSGSRSHQGPSRKRWYMCVRYESCAKYSVVFILTAILSQLNCLLFFVGNWGHHRQGSCQAGLGASISKVTHLHFLVLFIIARYISSGIVTRTAQNMKPTPAEREIVCRLLCPCHVCKNTLLYLILSLLKPIQILTFSLLNDHAIAQAVSRRLPPPLPRGCPGSVPVQAAWDLSWTKWHRGMSSRSTAVSPANSQPTNCWTFINHRRHIVSLLTALSFEDPF